MTLRNTSGKFTASLANFGRKASGIIDSPSSPSRTTGTGYLDDENSSNSPNAGFSGIGGKLGKTLAHQSLLPGLGNKDMRALQEVIINEKAVMQLVEKFAIETQKAASSLVPYGTQEGPDLQDILTHSSTLLNHLSNALVVYTQHEAAMRNCLKRIREREEALDELRRRRRSTGGKAEAAERKLAKMGPENKGLPQQTELLERLRQDMRQMDTEIITEESKIGDFKRQIVKESLSLKFGGLEELGEKMCIIGELGKLVLEEVPLEETPPGYGRAPYYGYERTENAVTEATKCLSTVQFHAASSAPKATAMGSHRSGNGLGTSFVPESRIHAAEDYANLPGNLASPGLENGKGRDFALDESNPYGGMSNPYNGGGGYDEYGGSRANESQVVWQGPTEDALHFHTQAQTQPQAQPESHSQPQASASAEGHGYEYEQQQQLDAEREREQAAWREREAVSHVQTPQTIDVPQSPWEPLNVRRDLISEPQQDANVNESLANHNLAPALDLPSTDPEIADTHTSIPNHIALPPPPTTFSRTETTDGGFYTPLEQPAPLPDLTPANHDENNDEDLPAPPPPIPAARNIDRPSSPSYASGSGGKISAAAFRKNKPRTSTSDSVDLVSNLSNESGSGNGMGNKMRRLPVPPLVPEERVGTPTGMKMGSGSGNTIGGDGVEEGRSPPPGYGYNEEGLR